MLNLYTKLVVAKLSVYTQRNAIPPPPSSPPIRYRWQLTPKDSYAGRIEEPKRLMSIVIRRPIEDTLWED